MSTRLAAPERRDAGADLGDRPGDLVAEDDRRRLEGRRAVVDVVQVGVADAAARHPHQHLAGARLGRGHLLEARAAGARRGTRRPSRRPPGVDDAVFLQLGVAVAALLAQVLRGGRLEPHVEAERSGRARWPPRAGGPPPGTGGPSPPATRASSCAGRPDRRPGSGRPIRRAACSAAARLARRWRPSTAAPRAAVNCASGSGGTFTSWPSCSADDRAPWSGSAGCRRPA